MRERERERERDVRERENGMRDERERAGMEGRKGSGREARGVETNQIVGPS